MNDNLSVFIDIGNTPYMSLIFKLLFRLKNNNLINRDRVLHRPNKTKETPTPPHALVITRFSSPYRDSL